ncbi:MAG: ABC transporter substrate-binding protein [Desulfovibrio sp.]|nr:ABC transporter substrate-binding protein [Desulfovibrio sp.]
MRISTTYGRALARLTLGLLTLVLLGSLSACKMPFGSQKSPVAPPPMAPPSAGACVVLALPASGPYAPIGGKVRQGAQMAQKEMAANGVTMRIEVVNTEAADWLQKLKALPPSCAVVGGPLQASNYAQARNAGGTAERVFFTFLPSLEQGDEGARAWRFFPSPQDQIDALINFASDGLNIRSYGAFYPADAYGARMTDLMEQSLFKRNMALQKDSYNPADPTSWSTAVAPLINAKIPEGSSTPVPQTAFEALFLPDSWKNMETLTTSLLYNGEDRLVLLGTTLWEQGLSGKVVTTPEKYALAVFPAAWNPTRAPRALQAPGLDFWNALGYDFARFAVSLGLTARLSSPEVTARAQRAAQMVWSMAPITWDNAGVAHQNLFIFGVSPTGMVPVNLEEFGQTHSAILQQSALRMQGLPPVDAAGNPVSPGAGQQPTLQPIGTTPKPSYRLSLPSHI